MGTLSHVGGKDTPGATEVVLKSTRSGGTGVTLEEVHGDMVSVKRLVYAVEQVFVGKMHFTNDY